MKHLILLLTLLYCLHLAPAISTPLKLSDTNSTLKGLFLPTK